MTMAASVTASVTEEAPLGILAAGGALPAEVARAVAAGGRRVVLLALIGVASPDLAAFDPIWLKRGQLGRLFRTCRQRGVRQLVLIGGMDRRMPRVSECDLTGLWQAWRHRDMLRAGDDSVLRRVARLLEPGGLTLVGAAEVAPGLLAPTGAMGAFAPPDASLIDIATGLAAARDLGRRDVGQGVVVAGGAVVAREGVAGTDAMLAELAASGAARGGVLVKCLKPQQDRRFDMPAIGPGTVAAARAAGLAGIAVEAGATLIAERARTLQAADAAGLFVYGAAVPGRGP
jgi:DUF1009 family protein